MNVIVSDLDSGQVVFKHPDEGSKNNITNSNNNNNNPPPPGTTPYGDRDHLMQLLTPFLVSAKVLKDELKANVRQIRIGRRSVIVSTHLNKFALIVFSKNDGATVVEVTSFHSAFKSFLFLVTGLSWSLLNSNPAPRSAASNFVLSWESIVRRRPHAILGLSGVPMVLAASTKESLRQFVLADQVSRELLMSNENHKHLLCVVNQIWVVVEKEGSFSRPFCVVPAKKSTTSTCVVADAADSGLKLDLVALDALCKAQASAMKMSTTRPLRDLEAITGLPIYIQRGCERIDQYFLRIIPRNDCNVVTIEHSPNASRLCSLKLASVASLRSMERLTNCLDYPEKIDSEIKMLMRLSHATSEVSEAFSTKLRSAITELEYALGTSRISPVAFEHIQQSVDSFTKYVHSVVLAHEVSAEDDIDGFVDLRSKMKWTRLISRLARDLKIVTEASSNINCPRLQQCLRRHDPNAVNWILMETSNMTVLAFDPNAETVTKDKFYEEIYKKWTTTSPASSLNHDHNITDQSSTVTSMWQADVDKVVPKTIEGSEEQARIHTIFCYKWTQPSESDQDLVGRGRLLKAKIGKVLSKMHMNDPYHTSSTERPLKLELYILCKNKV